VWRGTIASTGANSLASAETRGKLARFGAIVKRHGLVERLRHRGLLNGFEFFGQLQVDVVLIAREQVAVGVRIN
jgi:hypothetical protein